MGGAWRICGDALRVKENGVPRLILRKNKGGGASHETSHFLNRDLGTLQREKHYATFALIFANSPQIQNKQELRVYYHVQSIRHVFSIEVHPAIGGDQGRDEGQATPLRNMMTLLTFPYEPL
jgi:hypothetical protein